MAQPFQIVFQATHGNGSDGDLAIDDIDIDTNGLCGPAASCTFDESTCLWTQKPVGNTTADFSLIRVNGRQLNRIMASIGTNSTTQTIAADAHSRSPFGHFLWMNYMLYANASAERMASLVANKTATKLTSETLFPHMTR